MTKKLAYLISLQDQLLDVWRQLDGQYAEWTEQNIHQILHSKRRTAALRCSWDEYSNTEQQVAISFMQYHLLPGYQKQLRQKQDTQRAEWARNKAIRTNCLKYKDMVEASLREYSTKLPVQMYELAACIEGVNYYQKRETPLELWNERRARDFWNAKCLYSEDAQQFPAPWFESVTVDGFPGTYYRPLFQQIIPGA